MMGTKEKQETETTLRGQDVSGWTDQAETQLQSVSPGLMSSLDVILICLVSLSEDGLQVRLLQETIV